MADPRRRRPPPVGGLRAEDAVEGLFGPDAATGVDRALSIAEVDPARSGPVPTGLVELDRVLGGGLVPGSVTLLGGEPGVGKSTLLLQVLAARARTGAAVLLVSAEESAQQVRRRRAERLGPLPPGLMILDSADLSALPDGGARHRSRPRRGRLDPGRRRPRRGRASPAAWARSGRAPTSWSTWPSRSAWPSCSWATSPRRGLWPGPRTLEHLVDTVLGVEGDRHHALRTVRATKHRFGPTGELGLFEMNDAGLAAVTDPYRLLLGDRRPGAPGSAVCPPCRDSGPCWSRSRPSRRAPPADTPSRRSAQGVDGGRLALLLAVLEQRAGVSLARTDVFASAVGGIRVLEPAADLALALALASAVTGRPLPADLVVFGEVGLGGEVRQVPHAPRRLAEAARVGFRHARRPRVVSRRAAGHGGRARAVAGPGGGAGTGVDRRSP